VDTYSLEGVKNALRLGADPNGWYLPNRKIVHGVEWKCNNHVPSHINTHHIFWEKMRPIVHELVQAGMDISDFRQRELELFRLSREDHRKAGKTALSKPLGEETVRDLRQEQFNDTLDWACVNGYHHVAKILLDNGAVGKRPYLAQAIQSGYPKLAKL